MQRFRRHLSYANVVATLALVVATAGGAYAVDQIGTREVKNNSLQSSDLKNRKAVVGRDVRRNSLAGSEILERRLNTRQLVTLAGDDAGVCDPLGPDPVECVATRVGLARPMTLQVTAAGALSTSGSDPAIATCTIQVDGDDEIVELNPGEASSVNTSLFATDGFAGTYTSEPLAPGSHEVGLSCRQIGSADAVIEDPSIAVIAVAAP